MHGREHRATVDARRQLAALYVDLGRFGEAESEFLDVYAWMRARLDPNHPDMAQTYNSLGIVYWERGDLARAIQYQTRAVEAWRPGPNMGLTAAGAHNLAMILQSAGRLREALPLAREARSLRARRYGDTHDLVGDSDRLLGEILAGLGRDAEARETLQRAVQLTRAGYGPAHSHTRRAEVSLARFEATGGDAVALQQLRTWGRYAGRDIEQRKASWLARAYAAGVDCGSQPALARRDLDALLASIQLDLPEGGALPREISAIRARCGVR
jgi:serine/threonine-protein kinase